MKFQGLKLAIFAFFVCLGGLFPISGVFAVSYDFDFLPGANIGDSYPVYDQTISVPEDTQAVLVHVRMADPYIKTYLDWVKLNGVVLNRVGSTAELKSGWYLKESPTEGAQHIKVELSGQDAYISDVDVFYVSGYQHLISTSTDFQSGLTLSHTFNISDTENKAIFSAGSGQYSSISGGYGVHNYSGTNSVASSTLSLNNTITKTFGSATARSDFGMLFQTRYTLGATPLSFNAIPGMVYEDPKYCPYGEDCIWSFFYDTYDYNDENAGVFSLVNSETQITVATSSIYLNIPFQNFEYTIASTTGFAIGDSDEYYMSIVDASSTLLWSATGTIVWQASTTDQWVDDWFPECNKTEVCPFISTTTSFWSSENFACGMTLGACYMFKPSSASVNMITSSFSGLEDNFPLNAFFGVKDDILAWQNVEVDASSTLVEFTYHGYDIELFKPDYSKDLLPDATRERLLQWMDFAFGIALAFALLFMVINMRRKDDGD